MTTAQPNMPYRPTESIYLTYDGNFILNCFAIITNVSILPNDDKEESGSLTDSEGCDVDVEIHLDQSTMHPQGGGQPSDIGTITCKATNSSPNPLLINVHKVTKDRTSGVVSHFGKIANFDDMSCLIGSEVTVAVDPDRRRIMSECHTAGHVIDAAMAKIGQVMPPTKGYHFLDGPYVEYKGSIPTDKRADVLDRLKAAFQDLVAEDIETKVDTLPKDEAENVCNRLAQNFDLSDYDQNVRVVTVAGWPCPCGGTHVKSTMELKERGWGVTGLKCKKNVVRVKYGPASK